MSLSYFAELNKIEGNVQGLEKNISTLEDKIRDIQIQNRDFDELKKMINKLDDDLENAMKEFGYFKSISGHWTKTQ